MVSNKFNLPLQYNELHQYFDILNPTDDTPTNMWIESILQQHNVVTVLDMTCGTGSQVLYLAQNGYKVTGSDLSPELVNIAKNKAKQQKLDIPLIIGDMRTVQVDQFDAVITIANAIGHLTKTDFNKTLRNISKNLKKDGLYIFDIFNLQAMTDEAVKNLAMNYQHSINDTGIHHIQCSTINRTKGLLTSYDYFVFQENIKKPTLTTSDFTLQIYTVQELKDMLMKNGFEILNLYGLHGSKFLKDKTENIFMVARKKHDEK